MSDIKLITKSELDDFLKQQKHIYELIEVKTEELALILHGRLPIGEIGCFDIEKSEFKIDCIHVFYEEYCCGETNYDSYDLPFEFLYNEKYPVHFKYLHDEEQRKLKDEEDKKQHEIDETLKKSKESWERSELKRLKEKYEGVEMYDCERCGISFEKGNLIVYNDEMLCFDCKAEVESEEESPFDI